MNKQEICHKAITHTHRETKQREICIMKKKKEAIGWTIAILAVFISLYLDNVFIENISLIRNSVLDWVFLLITFVSSEVILLLILTALFLWRDNKRRWILPVWLSIGVSALVSFILKLAIQKPRPYQTGIISLLPSLSEASHDLWNFSFPSSHAMLAFCAIPILAEQYPKLKKVWIAFAVLIAFSRIYFGLHFVSDIIIGALMGYVIGLLVVKLEKEHKFGKNVYNKVFGR
jgi:undecaprenyl-diphosphatase